jgi:FkbM family methyltransferase
MTSEFDRFLKDDMYNRYIDDLVTTPSSVTFDVGSYTGNSLVSLAQKVNGKIYGFEPVREFWKVASERVKSFPNIQVVNIGLGKNDEYKVLNLQNDETSVFKPSSKGQQCIFRSIFNVWNAIGISKLDVLHMNVEGGEYDIFECLIKQNLLPKIRTIIVQFHYPEQFSSQRAMIQEELKKTHTCVYDYAFVWERWNLREE